MDSIFNLINQIEQQSGTEGMRCGAIYELPNGGGAVVTAVGEDRITIELIVLTAREGETTTSTIEPLGLHLSSDFHGPINPS